ncbi:MAG: TIGR04211 family SH3 domain-containing protein [Gammaproteobacteria bacterium]|nr:TIGR04211 family SH3 domain-containing protein [Gammaproteobacteria bacterium]
MKNRKLKKKPNPWTILLGVWLYATGGQLTLIAAAAETMYISDSLTVPLRSGPSNSHRILHRGLASGTALEVIERDDESGFAHIRTLRGTDGWLPMQYLVAEPIARDRLKQANTQIAQLNTASEELRAQLALLGRDQGQSQQINVQLTSQVAGLEAELEDIKQISKGAIEEHASNLRLLDLNARVREELDDLVAERNALQENLQQQWMLVGGGLVLLGLVLGTVIKARPRRSGWS